MSSQHLINMLPNGGSWLSGQGGSNVQQGLAPPKFDAYLKK